MPEVYGAGSCWRYACFPMPPPVLVLDSNVYGFEPLHELARLAERGFVLRVSEVALYERLAASFRDHVERQRVAGRKRIDQRRAAETAAVTYNPLGAFVVRATANRFGNEVASHNRSFTCE